MSEDQNFYQSVLQRIPAREDIPHWNEACISTAHAAAALASDLRRKHRQELLDELIAEADARLEVEMRSWGGYAEGTDCDGWSFMSSVLTDARNKESKG